MFDLILITFVLHEMPASLRSAVLTECRRVLKASGRLVLSTPNHASIVERAKRVAVRHGWLRSRLPSMCLPEEGTARDDYHPYRYHRPLPDREIAARVEAAGFHVTSMYHFLFTMKNTPDALAAVWRTGEAMLERTPVARRLAATVCIVADCI